MKLVFLGGSNVYGVVSEILEMLGGGGERELLLPLFI